MFYVYEHLRQDTGAVFYVGKGSGARCKTSQGRNKWWHAIAAKHGYKAAIKVKVDSEELAYLAEQELIDQYRRLGFQLVNATDGGEGMTGHKMAPEVIERRAAKQRGQKRPHVSEKLKGVLKTEAHKLAMSLSRIGKPLSVAAKEAIKNRKTKPRKPMQLSFGSVMRRPDSQETKLKKSLARMGSKNPRYGVKLSQEQID